MTRTFGSLTTVDCLNLEIPTDIVYSLLDPSGAGKSTALYMITTLLAPARDWAMALGHDVVYGRHAVHGLIGVTGQYTSIDETLTGSGNLYLFERLLGLGRRRARGRAEELLAASGLIETDGKRVSGCSGGARRQLDLAVSLIPCPPLIFLNEPTTDLDPHTREQMWDTIHPLVKDGSTVPLTTQYLEEADRLAHRVGIIDAGRLITEDTPNELKDRTDSSSLVLTPAIPEDQAATAAVIKWTADHAPATVDRGTYLQAPLSEASVATEALVALHNAGLLPRTVLVDHSSMDSVFMTLTEQPMKYGDAASPDAAASSAPSLTSLSFCPADPQGQS